MTRHGLNTPPPDRGARQDPSFETAVEAEAYRRDVPDAEIHILDAGHFALDEQPDRCAEIGRQFLRTALRG
jgi:pimeloyl-ACP methyl ester carboxylesterase